MPTNINPTIGFRQSSVFPMERSKGYFSPMPEITTENQVNNPSELNTPKAEKTKKKKGRFKNFIANVAKFFTKTSEMTKASTKAMWYGTLTGGATLFSFWVLDALPKQIKNKAFKKAFKEPLKSIGTKGKIISAVAALGVATFHIIKGVLNSNQRAANVDHKLNISHK